VVVLVRRQFSEGQSSSSRNVAAGFRNRAY
jgi:hypothetical protein